MSMTRRDFVKTSFAGLPLYAALAGKIDSTVSGVRLGTITYSFRELPRSPGALDAVDLVIKALTECGIGEIELFSPDLQPRLAREDLRKWRLSTPMEHFKAVRKKFEDAGIALFAYTVNFRDDFTDDELEKSFEQTGQSARCKHYCRVHSAQRRQAAGSVRGETQDIRGDARPFQCTRRR